MQSSRKLVLSPRIVETLESALTQLVIEPNVTAIAKLTKDDLLRATPSDLEFVKKFVIGYYRKRRLSPKSLEDFISNEKYDSSCYVEISFTVKDLLNSGALWVEHTGDGARVVLGGKVLDPLRHSHIYGLFDETWSEPYKVAGVYSILEAFPGRLRDGRNVFEFEHGGIRFVLTPSRRELKGYARFVDTVANVAVFTSFDYITWNPTVESANTACSRARHLRESALKYVELLIKEAVAGGFAVERGSLDVKLEVVEESVYVKLEGKLHAKSNAEYTFTLEGAYPISTSQESIVVVTASKLVLDPLLASIVANVYGDQVSINVNGKQVVVKPASKTHVTVSATSEFTAQRASTPLPLPIPNFNVAITHVNNHIQIAKAILDDLKTRCLRSEHWKEVLKLIEWGSESDEDEVLLKVVLVSFDDKEVGYAMALESSLSGKIDEKSVAEATNNPVKTLAEMIASGKLKVCPDSGIMVVRDRMLRLPRDLWYKLTLVADALSSHPSGKQQQLPLTKPKRVAI